VTKVKHKQTEHHRIVNSFKNRLDDFLADMDNWKADAYKVHHQQVTNHMTEGVYW